MGSNEDKEMSYTPSEQKFENYCQKYFEDDFVYALLESAYTGKHRFYHTVSHIVHMFEDLNTLEHMIPEWDTFLWNKVEKTDMGKKVMKAILFHDYVYEMAENNELNSYLAYEKLFGKDKVVKQLIMATDHSNFEIKNLIMGKDGGKDNVLKLPMVDIFSVLVHDADLFSMTQRDQYIRQAKGVYKEYCSFETRKDISSEHIFNSFVDKRQQFLESMLKKDYIILLSNVLTNKIKSNMEYELKLIANKLYFYE
jgi:predicted metal-dependent HD superfamily phosphohydrolase